MEQLLRRAHSDSVKPRPRNRRQDLARAADANPKIRDKSHIRGNRGIECCSRDPVSCSPRSKTQGGAVTPTAHKRAGDKSQSARLLGSCRLSCATFFRARPSVIGVTLSQVESYRPSGVNIAFGQRSHARQTHQQDPDGSRRECPAIHVSVLAVTHSLTTTESTAAQHTFVQEHAR